MTEPVTPGAAPDEAPIRDLLVLAGPRPAPAAFRTARVRAAVEAEWRRSTRPRSRWSLWSLAAACAAALLVVWARSGSDAPVPAIRPDAQPFATVARVTGVVHAAVTGGAASPVTAGTRVGSAAAVETAEGRALLAFASGHTVRLDRQSRIAIEAATRLVLERGRIYVDSGERPPAGEGLQIATSSGLVREIGTRFEVAAAGGIVQVRVRDGAVRIEGRQTSMEIGSAEGVRIDAGGRFERKPLLPFGPEWSWLEAIAPGFAIEGATLDAFLHWVAREQGREWRYRDAAAIRHAATIVLHGTIEGLTPAEALEAVLPTCGMAAQLRGGTLVIGLASAQDRK